MIYLQYERIDNGLFHVFSCGRHLGLVVKTKQGWLFRSNTGYFSPYCSRRIDAVKTWPAISEYQLSKAVKM